MSKKKVLKVLGIGAAALVALVVVVGVVVFMNLDRIVRRSTEEVLAYALMVPVTVDGASVDIGEGIIEFRGINIPNPEGWNTERAMYFGVVRVEADIDSFQTDEPTIRLIQLSDAEITLEQDLRKSNIQHLIDNAMRLSSGEEAPKEEEPKPEGSQKAVKIERLVVEGTTAGVTLRQLGGNKLSVPVPKIDKTDIGGKGEERMSPPEAVEAVLGEILIAVVEAGGSIIPTEQLAAMRDGLMSSGSAVLSGAGDLASGTVGAVGDAAGATGEAVGGAVSGAADAVGGAVGGLGRSLGIGGKKEEEEKK
jgi:hypothetical protein